MILWNRKDGGPDSNTWCYGIEIKKWFSILILNFRGKSRPVYHSHAFNSISWVLWGRLDEEIFDDTIFNVYRPSFTPVITKRNTQHKVDSSTSTWLLNFRGPWSAKWKEAHKDKNIVLTHGRKEVSE